jgi:hypothetical protein
MTILPYDFTTERLDITALVQVWDSLKQLWQGFKINAIYITSSSIIPSKVSVFM